ncbi:hypothetical protein FOA52_002318 [Chlamydomonas sp. UWO 241]|nr:hypothetical protein FOA52_002318 [Chlamydomonas sp. UWO 241]
MSRKRGAGEVEASTSIKDPWATSSFTWRIENFSKVTSEPVRSASFEAGICTWVGRLLLDPEGVGHDNGTHLPVLLEVLDDMWEPSAECKGTLVKQADASDSICQAVALKFPMDKGRGSIMRLALTALKVAASNWIVNDTLVLTVEVSVEREDRFRLDAGVPCDMVLKLPCGAEMPTFSPFLQAASPFFRGALEDVKGSTAIPVDGSFGAWTYILSDLHQQRDPPALTLGSVLTLLPVVHKYDFTKLLTRLAAFVKARGGEMSHDPGLPSNFVVRWLALAERLQLDELRELCLGRLQGMTKEELRKATTVAQSTERGTERVVREEVSNLGNACLCKLFAILASK